MKTHTLILALSSLCATVASATDWVTAPSFFTHDPMSGQRVRQYSPIGPFYIHRRGDYRRSGFRHLRNSIQVGGTADHYHVVEEWGKPVRPYGEWRFPYRPYSVPYDLWGPPFPFQSPFFGGFPFKGAFPFGGHKNPPKDGFGVDHHRFHPYPGYTPQPWDDGRYAPYDSDGPYGYPDLLLRDPRPSREPPPADGGA